MTTPSGDDPTARPDQQPGYWESQAQLQGHQQGQWVPPPGYVQQPYGVPAVPSHPSASTAMVLGIVAVGGGLTCGFPLIVGPFAWVMGGRTVREIDASNGALGGRDQAQAGYVMGIIATGLLVLGGLVLAAYLVFMIAVLAPFF